MGRAIDDPTGAATLVIARGCDFVEVKTAAGQSFCLAVYEGSALDYHIGMFEDFYVLEGAPGTAMRSA